VEIRSLVSQAWESLNKVKERVGSGVSSDLGEARAKVIRDHVPIYVSENERFKRWVSANYIRVLDEEESLKETYYVRLEKKLGQHIS